MNIDENGIDFDEHQRRTAKCNASDPLKRLTSLRGMRLDRLEGQIARICSEQAT